jgi:nucleoside-diphosphate-sugar epimerase
MFHRLFETPVTIARLFITYGPTLKDFHKLVPYAILSLLRGESPRLSSGRRNVDWIYIDDVIDGLLMLAQTDQAIGKTVDIGSGVLVSIRELVEKITDIVRPDIAPHFDLNLDREFEEERVADLRATFKMVGWRPRVSLEEGLLATVNWFKGRVNHGTLERS